MMRILLNCYFLLLIIFVFSCKADSVNDEFNAKYGKELEALKKQRQDPNKENSQGFFSSQPTPQEINQSNPNKPYQDISKFGQENKNSFFRGENYYPDASSIPRKTANIFDLNYRLVSHPGFRRAGIEFDNIEIPKRDAYGVESAMSNKPYFSPGGKLLKNSVDQLIASKESFDNHNSEILVAEKQQILRKELMQKTFPKNQEIASLEPKEIKKKTKKKEVVKKQINPDQNKAVSGFSIRAVK